MARIPVTNYNPVPNGSGSGEAVIFGNGLLPLTLLRQDNRVNQHREQLRLAAQEKSRQEDFKNFKLAPKLDGDPWSPFNKEATGLSQDILGRWETVSQDKNLNSYQKDTIYNKDYAQYKGVINATIGAKEAHKEFLAARKDVEAGGVRNVGKLTEKMFDKLDRVDPVTGERKRMSALEFEPKIWNSIDNDLETYDVGASAKEFIDLTYGDYTNQQETAARPGGMGMNKSVTTDIFLIDPATNEPLLDSRSRPIPNTKSTSVLLKANSHQPTRVYLDTMQDEQEKRLQPVVDKMANNEQLTPEDYALINANSKKRSDFLADYVSSKGNLKVSQEQTYSRPITPRAATAKSGPVLSGGSGFGVTGIQTAATGASALPSPFVGEQPFIQSNDGTRKPIIATAFKMRNVNMQVPGKDLQLLQNNTESQDLQFGQPRMVMVTKNGAIVAPKNPKVLEAINSGDEARAKAATEQWFADALSRPDAREKGYRVTYAIESTPRKGENNLGSSEEFYQALRKSASSGRSMPSEKELRQKANQMYAKQNATFYPLYEGDTKRAIDGYTSGYSAQDAQMQAELRRINGLKHAPTKKAVPGFNLTSQTSAPAQPAAYKKAGTKKSGFNID